MVRRLWTLALCLMTATAFAQAPRDDGSGNDNSRGGRSRMRRGDAPQDGQTPGEVAPGGGRPGGPRGPGGEPGGPGGGGFRRSNPMFEALDADGDGEISLVELKKAAVVLKKLDADGDGRITMDEASPRGGPGGGMFGDPAQFVDQMFEQNDKDGDGMLSKDEMPERGGRMLENADKDGDGKVSKEEATTAMEEMRNRFRGGGGPGGPGGGQGGPGGGRFGDPQQMISRMDRDGDGKISPQEAGQMGPMLKGGDANGDGLIDKAELEAAMKRMSEQRGGPGGGYGRGRGGDQGQGAPGGEPGQGAPGGGRRGRPQPDQK